MKKKKKKILLIGLVLFVILLVPIYLGYLTLVDFKPEAEISLENEINNRLILEKNEPIKLVTYNLGYGGMDKDVHFFMDGGKMSRGISEARVIHNIKMGTEVLKETDADMMILQEIDLDSSRSFHVDQYEILQEAFQDYNRVYGINYDVPWIALPIFEPHGKVLASQVNLANKLIEKSVRVALPIDETWPIRLAGLDRMMLVSEMPVRNGKSLFVINVHLSAYDKGGEIRKSQLSFVQNYIDELYQLGHYVIIGGDWNQGLPGVDLSKFEAKETWPDWLVDIPSDFAQEGFDWYYDPNLPTCRNAGAPYTEGYNFLSIIDGFLVSDNIEVIQVEGIDLAFEYSDHNPVKIEFKLK